MAKNCINEQSIPTQVPSRHSHNMYRARTHETAACQCRYSTVHSHTTHSYSLHATYTPMSTPTHLPDACDQRVTPSWGIRGLPCISSQRKRRRRCVWRPTARMLLCAVRLRYRRFRSRAAPKISIGLGIDSPAQVALFCVKCASAQETPQSMTLQAYLIINCLRQEIVLCQLWRATTSKGLCVRHLN